MAATLETAGRGVISEHTPQAPPARALTAELKTMLAEMREARGQPVYDGETAIVLRAIERGAREVKATDGGDAGYADLIARLLQVTAVSPSPAGPAPSGALILP